MYCKIKRQTVFLCIFFITLKSVATTIGLLKRTMTHCNLENLQAITLLSDIKHSRVFKEISKVNKLVPNPLEIARKHLQIAI